MSTQARGEGRISFRPLLRDDFPMFYRWLAAPHVEPWWQTDFRPEAVEREFGPVVDGTDPTDACIVELDGAAVGMVQRYRLSDNPDWQRALEPTGVPLDGAGFDYLIGLENLIGQGLGPAMLALLVEDTWARYPEVPALVVDVSPDNRRSWRALEKIGFERVWEGDLETVDPTDAGPAFVYLLRRPETDLEG